LEHIGMLWTSHVQSMYLNEVSPTKTHYMCCNPSFGLATKAKGLQRCGVRGSPRVTSHTPGSVGKCEGVNPHTPKATPTLGDGVPMDSQNFKEKFEGSKLNGLWRSLYHWKALETLISKMGSHCSFGHLKHKLWPKERPGVKLPVWLPTRKSQESTRFTWLQTTCDIPLKSSRRELQLCFRSHLDPRSARKVMRFQSRESPGWHDFGAPTRESRERKVIWMWAPWRGWEYTIRGKVVASPKSRPWWVLCVRVACGLS
jgi:hypothetical protein